MSRSGKLSVRRICCIGLIASAYACTTWFLSPLSYGPLQFRVSELLKPLVFFYPDSILAFAVGVLAANVLSPYAGPWELVFMPIANIAGGCLAIKASKYGVFTGAMVFAGIIALAVSITLSKALQLDVLALLPPILVSEMVLLAIGVPLTKQIGRIINEWVDSGQA